MALIGTREVELGFKAPGFLLPEPKSNAVLSLDELKGKNGTLLMFICNHCPYVIHVIEGLVKLAEDYTPKGISFAAINSNDVDSYPADSPANMVLFAQEHHFPFPYLYDETQAVAKAYFAECTPDFDLLDAEGKVVYRGRFDASSPGNNNPVNGKDLHEAMQLLLTGKRQKEEQIPSIGCSIKWKV